MEMPTCTSISSKEKENLNSGKLGKRKRGLKPRSKRNRKRKRGGVGIPEVNGNGQSEYHVQIDVLPLAVTHHSIATRMKQDRCQVIGQESIESASAPSISAKRVRVVRPYPFTYATFAKQRWVDRKIIDVYNDEFGSYPKSYYESAIRDGRILVSGMKVTCDYEIKGQDELTHTVHRHEPVVAVCDAIEIPVEASSSESKVDTNCGSGSSTKFPLVRFVHEDEEVVVVDKPATIPVHPSGGYNFNSLCHILAEQDSSLEGCLFNVHRLDRLTSGLTIVAKSTEAARILGKCVQDRSHCHKVYLARVKGKFPMDAESNVQGKALFRSFELGHDTVNLSVSPCIYGEWNENVKSDFRKVADAKPEGGQVDCDQEMLVSGELTNSNQQATDDSNTATCSWITNSKGMIKNDASLKDIFNSRLDVGKLSQNGDSADEATLWLNLAVPCEVACHKNGICRAGKGKPAQTSFAVVSYDEKTNSTVVVAKPQTGRTHQIRLHLQYLCHPIANDPNYGGELFFGDEEERKMSVVARSQMNEYDRILDDQCIRPEDATSVDTPATDMEVAHAGAHMKLEGESVLEFIQRSCVWCARTKGEDRTVLEFLVRSSGIWLHALQYSLIGPKGKVCYKTMSPNWSL